MADTTPTTPAGQAPNGDGTQPGQAPNPDGQAPNGTQTPDTSKWTIEDWKRAYAVKDEAAKSANAEAAANRVKARSLEEKQTKAERDAAAAEEDRKKKQGEFQQLADQYKAELDTAKPALESANATIAELTGILTAQLEAEIKDWPAEIKAMDPGKEAGLKARSAWRDKAKIAVEKFAPTGAPARPGNRPNPPASGGNGKDVVAELRSTGNYQRF